MQAVGSDFVLPPFSVASRPQKLWTPTFQVPSWYTAVPVWFFSAGVPATRIVYTTWACEDVITVTFVTCAEAEDARLDPAWDLMMDANVDPSCSRATRRVTGVFALKNATQFAAITFWSAEMADEVEEADGVTAAEDGDALGAELLVPLLLQAATPNAAAHGSRIEVINRRLITQTFSSFALALAMLILTRTSARLAGWPHSAAECPGHPVISEAAWSGTYVCISRGTRT